jgi:hypothetical protein
MRILSPMRESNRRRRRQFGSKTGRGREYVDLR